MSVNYHPFDEAISFLNVIGVLSVIFYPFNGVIGVLSVNFHPFNGAISFMIVNYNPSDELLSILYNLITLNTHKENFNN